MQGAAVFDHNGRRKYLNSLERRAYLHPSGESAPSDADIKVPPDLTH
jgi:hypothetical protein